eukprot:gnl/TRDRNA2_/TRDRNA2_134671_c0_seq1.p1 gnl/TRDRNA2_/TRDRNA2_134671_c0~~gnl/TRDRNA2_/TRDRNA2_134671_c0_seq1.p1  ORF type:complete len:252 (-),score=28.69 gnl/TRDRNA2_/TRDRNA2_134671_c0_seq1:208-963(-)
MPSGRFLSPASDEPPRNSSVSVVGTRAEWLLLDVPKWRKALPCGEAVESPTFAVDVPGAGTISGFRLRFFPSGGRAVSAGNDAGADICSLYLVHPADIPWVQYSLAVGGAQRGTFDSNFSGSDDFCSLPPELTQVDGVPAVKLSVDFLPVSRSRSQSPSHSPKQARGTPPVVWSTVLLAPSRTGTPTAEAQQWTSPTSPSSSSMMSMRQSLLVPTPRARPESMQLGPPSSAEVRVRPPPSEIPWSSSNRPA